MNLTIKSSEHSRGLQKQFSVVIGLKAIFSLCVTLCDQQAAEGYEGYISLYTHCMASGHPLFWHELTSGFSDLCSLWTMGFHHIVQSLQRPTKLHLSVPSFAHTGQHLLLLKLLPLLKAHFQLCLDLLMLHFAGWKCYSWVSTSRSGHGGRQLIVEMEDCESELGRNKTGEWGSSGVGLSVLVQI